MNCGSCFVEDTKTVQVIFSPSSESFNFLLMNDYWVRSDEIITSLCFCFFSLCAARKSLSPVLDSGGSLVVKRRSPEELEKDLRGAEAAPELSLHPKEGLGGAEGQSLIHLGFYLNLNVLFVVLFSH